MRIGEVEAGEDEQGGDVGLEDERCPGLVAGLGGVATGFAYLGQAGVGCGGVGIGGEGELELGFGFGDEALLEIVERELGVFGGALGGREGREAGGAHLVELEGGLAEAGLGVIAADAFEGAKGAVGGGLEPGAGRDGFELGAEFEGFVVGGLQLEGGVAFAGGAGGVAGAEEGDGEVVVVVLVRGIDGGGALEEVDAVLALAAEGDADVVDDLGEREAGGDKLEGLLGG